MNSSLRVSIIRKFTSNLNHAFPACIALLLLSVTIVAQQNARIEQLRADEEARAKLNAKLKEDDEKMRKQAEAVMNSPVNSRREPRPTLYESESQLPANEKKILAPDNQELTKYETFLHQPGTGLCKLFAINEARLAMTDVKFGRSYPHLVGNGAFYSFTKHTHNADEWAQIRLKDGVFYPAYTEMKRTTTAASGGMTQSFSYTSGFSFAVFTALRTVAMEEINSDHAAVRILTELAIPTTYQTFTEQIKTYSTGLNVGAHRLQSSISANPELIYLMRSINYKKADVIIVFRIVQQDRDGNLHILWKQLKSFPSAELKGKPPKP